MMKVMKLMMNNLLKKLKNKKLRNKNEKIKVEKDHLIYHLTHRVK